MKSRRKPVTLFWFEDAHVGEQLEVLVEHLVEVAARQAARS